MKKLFFALLIVVAVLVFRKLIAENASAEQRYGTETISEVTVFDIRDEQISEDDLNEKAEEVEEEHPELTAGDDETVVAE